MCGRYSDQFTWAELHALYSLSDEPTTPNTYAPRWNIAPTQTMPVIRWNPETKSRALDLLRWGLVPSWAKELAIGARMINARAETIAEKPAFRDAFRKRRCLVPASGFYEWRGDKPPKQPFAIGMADGGPMAFAGLWERWRAPDGEIVRTFAIATTEANEVLRPIHERMPVILARDDWPVWLGEDEGDAAALMRPCPPDWVKAWPVSTRVNKVANNDASLLEPIA